MSYDLMVFRKEAAPKTKAAFMNWYQNQTKWSEDHSYDDPANTSENLKNWFMEMKDILPAMNGPFASDNIDDDNVTDYCIGKDVIYAAFSWLRTKLAYNKTIELAAKHQVGFFDTSGNGDILIPDENGKLLPIEGIDKRNKAWWKFW